ncbi:MAG: TolC family protein [Phycisphaerae bacterium]
MICLVPAGCATYQAKPLKPAVFQSQFQARTLAATGLKNFIARQPIKPQPGFPRVQTLSTLVATAWYYSPALRMQLAQLAVDRANMITASQSPNPTVALSPTYAAKAGPGISPWILGFNFNIPIETAGRRSDRMAQAKALTQAGKYDLGQMAWNIRQGVRKALIQYIFAQKRVRVLRRQAQTTATILSLIQSRFHAGDISRPVYTAAEIQARQATLALVAAQGQVRQRRIELAGAMSIPERALVGVRLSYAPLMKTPRVHSLNMKRLSRAALMNRMDIQSLLAQYRAAEAALKLQIARQYPNIQLGPGYSFNQGANEFTLGFTMALPIFNQNQGAIAAANAQRLIIAAELQQKQTSVITQIRSALSQYRSALRQWHTAYAIEMQARTQLLSTRSAFKAGAQSRLAVSEAQLALNTFALATLQARISAVLALGNLEAILEKPLGNTPAMPKGTKP